MDEYIELISRIKQEFYTECGIPKALFEEKEEKMKKFKIFNKKNLVISKI